MDLERLAKDLAYWETIDPTGGEATHYSRFSTYPWLREEPLGFFLDDGVWGKYGRKGQGVQHIAEAIPKPVGHKVAWDAVEWPIPVGQWAIAMIDGLSQEVQIIAHVLDKDQVELIAQGEDNWDFFANKSDFQPFPDVVQERKRQRVLGKLEQWFENALQPFHDTEEQEYLARQVIEDVDFLKELLEKL